jgi:hypothetical protein
MCDARAVPIRGHFLPRFPAIIASLSLVQPESVQSFESFVLVALRLHVLIPRESLRVIMDASQYCLEYERGIDTVFMNCNVEETY